MDLTALIEYTSPGSIKRVIRSPTGAEGNPWPGIDEWSVSDYQNALDTLVEWTGTPISGAEVHANIAAYNGRPPPPPPEARLEEMAKRVENITSVSELRTIMAELVRTL